MKVKGISARYRSRVYVRIKARGFLLRIIVSAHVVAPELMTRSIGSRARANNDDATDAPAAREPQHTSNSCLMIREESSIRASEPLLSPRSGRSIAPRSDPSPLIDTRIHLVSFLSAKWPGDPPAGSFLSDSTPRYLSKFLSFFSFLYLRRKPNAR